MSNEAAKAIRKELSETRKARRELEQQEKRLTRALEALDGPVREEHGPRVPMTKRAEEVLGYVTACGLEKVRLRKVIEDTDVPKTSIYKAAEVLVEAGKLNRDGKNGKVSIDDFVWLAGQSKRKPTVLRPGEGVRP